MSLISKIQFFVHQQIKSPACLFVLNRIPWNLLGFASMALLQNQQTNLGFRLQQPAYNIQLFIIYWHRIIIWAAE